MAKKILLAFAITLLILICDTRILPILKLQFYHGMNNQSILLSEFLIFFILVILGLTVSSFIGLPALLPKGSVNWRNLAIIGVLVILANSLIYYFGRSQAMTAAPWLKSLKIADIPFLSLRAGLTEEVMFRLFLFSLIAWPLSKVLKSPILYLSLSAIISSLLFGAIHGSGFLIAFLMGLVLCYVYIRGGLLSAMTIHFLGNLIPISLFVLFWR